jgi:hypothetical protein
MIHWVEFNRASRPKCFRCGSTRTEPESDGAKDDLLVGMANVVSADSKRGDLQPAEPKVANLVRRKKRVKSR